MVQSVCVCACVCVCVCACIVQMSHTAACKVVGVFPVKIVPGVPFLSAECSHLICVNEGVLMRGAIPLRASSRLATQAGAGGIGCMHSFFN